MEPKLSETIYCDFITSSPTTGAAIDADSLPTCEVFEDITDTAILSPTVVKRTGKTGNYRVPLVCTAANGFEAGKSYNAIVSATVGGIVAKSVLTSFLLRTNSIDDLATSILTRATPAQVQTELGTYGALKPTVAARTLDVNTTGEAGIDWANIGAPTTAQTLSATTFSTTQTVASATSVTNPVTLTAAYDPAKTAAQAGAAMTLTAGERTTLSGVIWNVLTSTLTTASTIGKLIVDNLNATVSSAVGDTPGTTTLLGRIASALTITAGKVDVNDKTGFALTAAYDAAKTASTQASVNTISGYVDTEVGAIKTVTDKLDTALEVDGAVWRYTANALEQAPVGGGGGATDWTSTERDQIRHRLGIDGSAAAPATGTPSLAKPGDAMTLTTGERTSISTTIWSTLTSALTVANSIGKLLVDNINATIASRSTYAGGDTAGTTTLLSRIASALTITAGKVDVNDKTGFSLTAVYDPAKTAAPVGAAMTLTSAYDAAKTASTQTSVDAIDDFVDMEVGAIKMVTDKLNTALEQDGAVYRYTINALENAPVGEGGGGSTATDWTPTERNQIRHRLGIDGSAAAPAAIPSLARQVSVDALQETSDKLETTWQLDGSVYQFTANALELAPVSEVGPPVTLGSPCAQNPARTRGPTTQPYPPGMVQVTRT